MAEKEAATEGVALAAGAQADGRGAPDGAAAPQPRQESSGHTGRHPAPLAVDVRETESDEAADTLPGAGETATDPDGNGTYRHMASSTTQWERPTKPLE